MLREFTLAVFALYPVERFLARFEGAFELARFHCFQDFAKSSGPVSFPARSDRSP